MNKLNNSQGRILYYLNQFPNDFVITPKLKENCDTSKYWLWTNLKILDENGYILQKSVFVDGSVNRWYKSWKITSKGIENINDRPKNKFLRIKYKILNFLIQKYPNYIKTMEIVEKINKSRTTITRTLNALTNKGYVKILEEKEGFSWRITDRGVAYVKGEGFLNGILYMKAMKLNKSARKYLKYKQSKGQKNLKNIIKFTNKYILSHTYLKSPHIVKVFLCQNKKCCYSPKSLSIRIAFYLSYLSQKNILTVYNNTGDKAHIYKKI